jgi:hypothetical protein
MVDAGLARSLVNARVNRIRRVFKWAASEELIPHATYQAPTTVSGLRLGRSAAHESEPVRPVEGWVVEATLPFLNRHVRALVPLRSESQHFRTPPHQAAGFVASTVRRLH